MASLDCRMPEMDNYSAARAIRDRDRAGSPVPIIALMPPPGKRRATNCLAARSAASPHQRRVDQMVVEHGTAPLDDLYLELKPLSRNRGAVDYERLVTGGAAFPDVNREGRFTLLRIGDAVASRNIHAAIYDGIRLMVRV